MIAKMVLPLLGGTPAVWATCMLFFQAMLLAGYTYAHWAPRWLGIRRHALLHIALIALPLCLLPIGIAGWEAPNNENPIPWLMALLIACAGLPFFMVSTSAPLLQRWFAATAHQSAHDPYFLYAASNCGSLIALLAYPLFVEPNFRLADQSRLWAGGYLILLFLVALCAFCVRRVSHSNGPDSRSFSPSQSDRVPWHQRIRWLAWAFVPSSLLLGVTIYLTTDIAAIPFLWVLPLAVYLLTFILAFSPLPHFVHSILVLTLLPIAAILIAVRVPALHLNLNIGVNILLNLAALFVTGMVCHGELSRSRPSTHHLTEFYLWISMGGVLGGIFNAILAPLIFDRIIEYPLVIAGAFLLQPHILPSALAKSRLVACVVSCSWISSGLFCAYLFIELAYGTHPETVRYMERNFFGLVTIRGSDGISQLFHGTTIHGIQQRTTGRAQEPLAYYSRGSPIGQVFDALGERVKPRIAVIGLGAGTLACYARPGQEWVFFEIDPAMERIARDRRFFTFLDDAEARGAVVKVILGDGRLQIARSSGGFGLIVLDAFSSDSIPLHLLSREALQVYFDKVAPGGIVAMHITNIYLRLEPVVATLAQVSGLAALGQCHLADPVTDQRQGIGSSQWVILARKPEDFGSLVHQPRWHPLIAGSKQTPWTDDYSNLLSVFNWNDTADSFNVSTPSKR
jgi:hypothetical protein